MTTDVSVILATYNSDLKRIFETLYSILIQQKITFDLVIADDGSENNYKKEIEDYLFEHNFTNYTFSLLEKNQGTVKNLIKGIELCKGKFIKCISPGDYFYNPYVLYDWTKFLIEKGSLYCFGRYLTYCPYKESTEELLESVKIGKRPYNIDLYFEELNNKNKTKIKYDYLLMDDFFLGASIVIEKNIFYDYLKIIEDKVKYCEDAIYRMMLADNIFPSFYEGITIWYSYGDGISTTKSSKWFFTVLNDHYKAGLILRERLNKLDWFEKRLSLYYKISKHLLIKIISKYILFPSLIRFRVRKDSYYDNILKYDISYLINILSSEED